MTRRNRDINLAVRVNKEEKLKLQLKATIEGKSVSQLIREIIK